MSLKHFHVVFIVAALALSLVFGVWSMKTVGANLLMGQASFVLGAVLAVYLVWFFKKKVSS